MSTTTERQELAISECADELEQAAEDATDLERQDALAALAAVARGEDVPRTVAERLRQRYGDA